jgi:hypothetical protein
MHLEIKSRGDVSTAQLANIRLWFRSAVFPKYKEVFDIEIEKVASDFLVAFKVKTTCGFMNIRGCLRQASVDVMNWTIVHGGLTSNALFDFLVR